MVIPGNQPEATDELSDRIPNAADAGAQAVLSFPAQATACCTCSSHAAEQDVHACACMTLVMCCFCSWLHSLLCLGVHMQTVTMKSFTNSSLTIPWRACATCLSAWVGVGKETVHPKHS